MSEPTYRISFWFRNILVPVDGSENSMRALDLAVDFAMRYGSQITVFYACETCNASIEGAVKERVGGRAKYELKIAKYSAGESSPASEIIREATEGNYDTIIMGARGLSVNSEVNIGSVALSVIASAQSTVIIVR